MTAAGRRVVLLTTSPRVAPGLFDGEGWAELRSAVVCAAASGHPQILVLGAAGVPVRLLPADDPVALAGQLLSVAADRPVVWLAGPAVDPALHAALDDAAAGAVPPVEVQVRAGNRDLPGGHLIDVVATMDRLRSPGGCPWDAEQTHASLRRYLLEEAYEAVQAIDDGDPVGLRDELGDVLLQVVFHARLAEEAPAGDRWTIDDVADGLVAKLVRRHPHVFADVSVAGPAEVVANWEAIKATEKPAAAESVLGDLPAVLPALTLADAVQQRAAAAGLPAELLAGPLAATGSPAGAVSAAAAGAAATPGLDTVGELLFAAVALARAHGVDAEAALRARVRRFTDQLAAAERDARGHGLDPRRLGHREWHQRWAAAGG